jgi:hypothetical protein
MRESVGTQRVFFSSDSPTISNSYGRDCLTKAVMYSARSRSQQTSTRRPSSHDTRGIKRVSVPETRQPVQPFRIASAKVLVLSSSLHFPS